MTSETSKPPPIAKPPRPSFGEDFRRFFLRGLAAVLPTMITLWLFVWAWNFLWRYLGTYIIEAIGWVWTLTDPKKLPYDPGSNFEYYLKAYVPTWAVQLIGVLLAILLVYIVGLFVGHFIGRAAWRLAEVGVMRIPLVRAIYPAVKQITDFLLADRRSQFQESRVVAVRPHEANIWSVGLVTGAGVRALSDAVGEEMVTVFVPSSPTAFSGYVLVVPRTSIVELPLTVEEALRLLISGGVITPETKGALIVGSKDPMLESPPPSADAAPAPFR